MKTTWLQSVGFENLGAIEPWLRRRGHKLSRIALCNGEKVPDTHSFDCLIVMGGAMVPTDDSQYPWLFDVLNLLRATVSSGRPIFGICLGAQLLGHAFGGRIEKSEQPEFGWHTVRRSPVNQSHELLRGMPAAFTTFQWHRDTVTVPAAGVTLASSDACPNQIFAIGSRALGVQFHPEITRQKAREFAICTPDQGAGPFVQDRRDILDQMQYFMEQEEILGRLLSNLLE